MTAKPEVLLHKGPGTQRIVSEGTQSGAVRRTEEERTRRITAHLGLVDAVVARLPFGVRVAVDHDDLVSYGSIGLIDAVDRWSTEARVGEFAAYARTRIRGAIYDELRRNDWLTRPARRSVTEFRRTRDDLRQREAHEPSHTEVLEALGHASARARRSVESALSAATVVSIDAPRRSRDGGRRPREVAATNDPEAEVIRRHSAAELGSAVATLDARSRRILRLRYRERWTLARVANELGISISRVAQLERRALAELRGAPQLRHIA